MPNSVIEVVIDREWGKSTEKQFQVIAFFLKENRKYMQTSKVIAAVVRKVAEDPKLVQTAPAITLASKVQILSQLV